MFSQTIVPSSSSVILHLPPDFIGEKVTVIAIIERSTSSEEPNIESSHSVKKTFEKYPRIDINKYKFDRNEADEYEEDINPFL
jgi:hypothetical protein